MFATHCCINYFCSIKNKYPNNNVLYQVLIWHSLKSKTFILQKKPVNYVKIDFNLRIFTNNIFISIISPNIQRSMDTNTRNGCIG